MPEIIFVSNSPGLSVSLPDTAQISHSPVQVTISPGYNNLLSRLCLSLKFSPFLARNVNFSYSQYGFSGIFARI